MWQVYDQPWFVDRYLSYRLDPASPNNQAEQPFIRSRLVPLKDKSVLDVGCGFGDFCRFASSSGASRVVGLDASTRMIGLATERQESAPINIRYVRKSIEVAVFPPEVFDVVVSSMVFHYVVDLHRVLANIARWLLPGGQLLMSMNHPDFTASLPVPRSHTHSGGGLRRHVFLGTEVIKIHRTIRDIVEALNQATFRICETARLSQGLTIAFACKKQ